MALRIAPWLYVHYREDREEAFKDLAEVAYLSRDAVWTSPRVLVKTALDQARREEGELEALRAERDNRRRLDIANYRASASSWERHGDYDG